MIHSRFSPRLADRGTISHGSTELHLFSEHHLLGYCRLAAWSPLFLLIPDFHHPNHVDLFVNFRFSLLVYHCGFADSETQS